MKKVLVLVFLCIKLHLSAQNPKLDNYFGKAGIVNTTLGSWNKEVANAIVQAPDGKFVCVGHDRSTNDKFIVARYTKLGELDLTFNKTGFNALDLGTSKDFGYDLVVLADNSIVGVGYATAGTQNIYVVKFKADGTLDNSFGNGGKFAIPFGNNDKGKSIIALADGSLLVGGTSGGTLILTKLTQNGAVDSSWGDSGYAQLDDPNGAIELNNMILDNNGKIVVTGEVDNDGGSNTASTDIFYARFNADGSNDIPSTRFGQAGIFEVGFGLALQKDGKVVIVGTKNTPSTVPTQTDKLECIMIRVNTNGTKDKEIVKDFGINLGESFRAVAIQKDGKIIAAGNVNFDNLVVRFNSDFTFDNTFGTNGAYQFGINGKDEINDILITNNSQIISAGYSTSQDQNGYNNFELTRLQTESTVHTIENSITESLYVNSYPVPTTDVLNLKYLLTNDSNVSIEVFDIIGNKVLSFDKGFQAAAVQLEKIDVSGLSNGTYICRIQTTNGTGNTKFSLIR